MIQSIPPSTLRYSSRAPLPRNVFSMLHQQYHDDDTSRDARRFKSSVAATDYSDVSSDTVWQSNNQFKAEIQRLRHIRNIGIFAHVDAGKTTVTERMLALAGVVRRAGSVDDGNTVTDFLPAERERGITIQSAAISFEWGWHNSPKGDDMEANDDVTISLIDTPGHIDFSVEVSRSVAVLDGAVLVVDAVAGVQAQTETVWRAMTRPSLNNHATTNDLQWNATQDHGHEPLSCIAVINKMDKVGSHFGNAIQSLRKKLPGANPIAIQIPLFRSNSPKNNGSLFRHNIVAVADEDSTIEGGEFVGVVDLIHMRAIVWPDLKESNGNVANVEDCIPEVIQLINLETQDPIDEHCQVTQEALTARYELLEALAEVDETVEEYYLNDYEPSNAELRMAVRRSTLSRRALPVMASAAVRGRGVEPIIDAIADLLPSPLERMPPALAPLDETAVADRVLDSNSPSVMALGHPLHSSALALAFKVVHMKGRGGSGDGRVVFARVYSGELRDRDAIQVISAPAPGEHPSAPRLERIGGMLELAGGRFGNLQEGVCKSGSVCALVGLKSVVTGDTLLVPSDSGKAKKNKKNDEVVYLSGVSAPKPVLTVRVEGENTEMQSRLSDALKLLAVEDPSLVVEESDSATLLSGLGELHIEVTLDRLHREFGLQVLVGTPTVSYRETVTQAIDSEGLVEYDRTIGGVRLQGAVHLLLEPTWRWDATSQQSGCMVLAEPIVVVGEKTKTFLDVDPDASDENLMKQSPIFKALVEGCQGALKRGHLGPYALANVKCHVLKVDAEGGLAALQALPGALRAASANAVSVLLSENKKSCTVLEPTMSVEVNLPSTMVGTVLSDLSGRRGSVGDVIVGDHRGGLEAKTLIRGSVPLAEILGYANSLRSLTGGEAAFTAEYKGHTPLKGFT